MAMARHVLVVEDEAPTRNAMRLALEAQGYRVVSAPSGREALDYLRRAESPSLILLDLTMPGMDGWEFRQEQRRDPALAAIPVVLLSGSEDVSQTAEQLGAVGYMHKPVEFDELLETVQSHC